MGDRPLLDRLCSHLESARVLLLLDNFEHLIASAPAVAALLQATAELRIVVTSRAPLHVSGEQEFEVPPLQVPDLQSATVAAVAGCESVRLFMERARAAWPGLVLNEENAAVIAGITQRLDGLPLAVELAAARVKLLPPRRCSRGWSEPCPCSSAAPVSCRNVSRLCVARSPGATSCSVREPVVCWRPARCSAAASALKPPSPSARRRSNWGSRSWTRLEELVDQSLLRRVEGFDGPDGPRFGMLYMVREYAAERLAEMPDRARIEAGHAATFLAMAQTAGPRTARSRRAGVARTARSRVSEHPGGHRLVHPARGPRCTTPGRGDVPLLGSPRSLHGGASAAEGAARHDRGRDLHTDQGASTVRHRLRSTRVITPRPTVCCARASG